MKIGVTFAVLNNFKGVTEAIHSAKSQEHDVVIDIVDQWRHQRALAGAWNEGAKRLFDQGCDYVAIANDDVIMSPTCLDALVKELHHPRDPKIILASANNILGEVRDDPYQILNKIDEYEGSTIADHPNFSLFMIGRKFFDETGTFDENYWPAWFEDSDSHYRIHLLGYRAITTTAASSIHWGSVSTRKLDCVDSSVSQKYFTFKWGSCVRDLDEEYKTPYNDPNMTPKDWDFRFGHHGEAQSQI